MPTPRDQLVILGNRKYMITKLDFGTLKHVVAAYEDEAVTVPENETAEMERELRAAKTKIMELQEELKKAKATRAGDSQTSGRRRGRG